MTIDFCGRLQWGKKGAHESWHVLSICHGERSSFHKLFHLTRSLGFSKDTMPKWNSGKFTKCKEILLQTCKNNRNYTKKQVPYAMPQILWQFDTLLSILSSWELFAECIRPFCHLPFPITSFYWTLVHFKLTTCFMPCHSSSSSENDSLQRWARPLSHNWEPEGSYSETSRGTLYTLSHMPPNTSPEFGPLKRWILGNSKTWPQTR